MILKNRKVRYLFAGGINTIVGYGIFSTLIAVGLHYSLATLLATTLGTLFNFYNYGILVFGNTDNSRIFRFFIIYAIIYLINVSFLGLLINFGFNAYLSGGILILPMALLGFILNRRYVYEN